MQSQDSNQSAFAKLRLVPQALAVAAGAGLILAANAGPGQAFEMKDADVNNAVLVASTTTVVTSSVVTTSVVTTSVVTSSVVTSSVVTSSSSSSSTGESIIGGTAFNQPGNALDLTTTA